jgi:hypothetical protein
VDLLARLRAMHTRMPPWLGGEGLPLVDNDHELQLPNGSRALAFPTTAGDSYTATLAVVDEADLIPDLDRLLRAVKPTTDSKGRLLLVSRADKGDPESTFKRTYRAARAGRSEWVPVFLPWHARPDRDAAWYERQRGDILARTGAEDDLHEQYPASDAEALAPRSLDRRLPPSWLTRCFEPQGPLTLGRGAPAIPGLTVYVLPEHGRRYVLGADPAEGNPTSDESALEVIGEETGEECAHLAGRYEPATFAAHLDTIGRWYNHARVLVERNDHGHAVLLRGLRRVMASPLATGARAPGDGPRGPVPRRSPGRGGGGGMVRAALRARTASLHRAPRDGREVKGPMPALAPPPEGGSPPL